MIAGELGVGAVVGWTLAPWLLRPASAVAAVAAAVGADLAAITLHEPIADAAIGCAASAGAAAAHLAWRQFIIEGQGDQA